MRSRSSEERPPGRSRRRSISGSGFIVQAESKGWPVTVSVMTHSAWIHSSHAVSQEGYEGSELGDLLSTGKNGAVCSPDGVEEGAQLSGKGDKLLGSGVGDPEYTVIGTSLGTSEGLFDGRIDGRSERISVGPLLVILGFDCCSVGRLVGSTRDGKRLGSIEGFSDCTHVGLLLCSIHGPAEGTPVGVSLGWSLTLELGSTEGTALGLLLGSELGFKDGTTEGSALGNVVGGELGFVLG